METIFWYFFKDIKTGEEKDAQPFMTFVGDIGEIVVVNGVKYEILDYAEENAYWSDLICE